MNFVHTNLKCICCKAITWGLVACIVACIDLSCFAESATSTTEQDYLVPSSKDSIPGAGPIMQGDWFQDKWRQLRSRWAEQVDQDQGALVFFGDSITEGWGGRLRESFAGIKVANRGIGGDTSRGLLYRVDDDVLSLKPAGVVMLIGTNDIQAGQQDPDINRKIAGNVGHLLDKFEQQNAQMPVILCLVMPSSATLQRPKEKITDLNMRLQRVAQMHPQVTVLDTWTLFADKQGDANPREFSDLLHLNEVGYRKWAAALGPLLVKANLWKTEREPF